MMSMKSKNAAKPLFHSVLSMLYKKDANWFAVENAYFVSLPIISFSRSAENKLRQEFKPFAASRIFHKIIKPFKI